MRYSAGILILLGLVPASTAIAQEGASYVTVRHNDSVYREVDTPPAFPGGLDSLMSFLKTKTVFPDVAKANGDYGVVLIEFVVNTDGSIEQLQIVKGVSAELDQEALRVCRSMPRWEAGMINGAPVRVILRLPFIFLLEEYTHEKKSGAKKQRARKSE